MDVHSDGEALAIIQSWGWDRFDPRFEIEVPVMMPLNEAINRLAMEGHLDPAKAVLSLLADGRVVSTGSYRWKRYLNGHNQREGIGEIPARRWVSLKEGLAENSKTFGLNEVTLHLMYEGWDEYKEARADWTWTADRFATAETSGGDFLNSGYFEETYVACDIEVRPAEVETADAPVPHANERNKGGAPSKYDWERAIAAIVFQWADDGTWHPTSQAEVKNKLADWFAGRDEQPSESLLKERARWLFEEFRRRGDEANNLAA